MIRGTCRECKKKDVWVVNDAELCDFCYIKFMGTPKTFLEYLQKVEMSEKK